MKPELKYCDNCALVFSAKRGQRFCSDGCRFEFHNAARAAANKSRDYITPEVKGYFQNIQILERLYSLKLQGPFSKEQLEKMKFQFDSLILDKFIRGECETTFYSSYKVIFNKATHIYTIGTRKKYGFNGNLKQ